MSTGLFIKEKASTALMSKPAICPMPKFGCALMHLPLMNVNFKIPAKIIEP